MRNLTFKAAMLKGSQPTVNRQSTDGQSQRHCKQTPLSKRWKVLMTLVFLFTFAIGQMWAAETVLFSSFANSTASNYFKSYTVDGKTVTVSASSTTISSSSGDYYCSMMQSTPSNNNDNYVELTVTGATIKTVSVLITGNGGDKTCQPALLGWEGAIANNTTADYVLVPASQVISNKGLSNAQWHQFDVHGNDLTKVRIYRAVKGVSVAGASAQTYGNAQSLQFYGIRVELEGVEAVCPETLTISSKDSKTAFDEGDAIELTAALAKGNGDISYQWYKDGTAEGNKLTGKNTNKLQIASCTTADEGSYYCVASKTSCDDVVNASAFAITVEADTKCFNMPEITSKPADLAHVTVSGGTLSDVSTAKSVAMNANGLKLDGNSVYLKVSLASASIVEGTKITVAWKGASSGAGLALVNENLASQVINETNVASAGSVSHTFTAEEAANYADEFILHRNGSGQGIYVNAITVEDCGPAVVKHTITLNYNDGVTPNGSLKVVDGKAATQPTDPTRGKYTFLGWFVGDTDNAYVWSSIVNDDITLKAHWQDPWTISFDADGGSEVADVTVKHNTKAEKPADPTKASHDFNGWYIGDTETQFDWDANVTQDYALKAHWLELVAKYDIEYYDGETKIGTEAQVRVDQHPTAAGIETSKPLMTFDGWFLNSALTGDPVALNTVTPSEGLKIYGKWSKAYAANIDFEAFIDDNTTSGDWEAELDDKHYAISSTTGVTLDAPNGKPADKGLKIKNSGSYLSFNVHAGKLVLLKAGVLSGAEASVDGGAHYATLTGATGSTAASVVTPLYNAAEAEYRIRTTTGSYNIIQSITIQDPYQVSFNANGGDDVASLNGTPSIILPSATKGTDSFLGWFTEETGGTKIGEAGESYTPTANITLVAHWEAVSTDARLASITFSSNAGTLSPAFDPEVTSYTYTMPYGTAAIPTITGATSVNAKAQDPIIGDAAAAWGDAQTVKGVAQSGDKKTYTITMVKAPKDGVCIIKGNVGNNTFVIDEDASLFAGTADKNNVRQNSSTYQEKIGWKFQARPARLGLTLSGDETFQEGDVVEVFVTSVANIEDANDKMRIFDATDATAAHVLYESEADMIQGANRFVLPATTTKSLYLHRTKDADYDNFNPYVAYVAVYRPMMPKLTAITINGEACVKGEGNTFTITLPEEGTNLGSLTVVPTVIRNEAHATTPEAVISNEGAWKAGDNTYRVMDKDGDYTDYTITITLQGQAPAPVIATQPAGVAYCAGSEPTLTVEATGNELHYAWFKEAGETDEAVGTDAASYTIASAGTYYVIITNHVDGKLDASVTSANAVVTLNVAAAITTQPTDLKKQTEGANITLSVVAANATGYQWYSCDNKDKENPSLIAGADEAEYEFAAAAGFFYCEVTGLCGTIESNVAEVTIKRTAGCQYITATSGYETTEGGLYICGTSNSDGLKATSGTVFATASNNAKAIDADADGAFNKQYIIFKFPVDVEEFTLYGYSTSTRSINNVRVNDHIGTNSSTDKFTSAMEVEATKTATKVGNDISLTAVMAEPIDHSNYVNVKFNGAIEIYRICYTEALAEPVLPTLGNQELCAGAAYAEIDATITNAAACTGTVSYQWYNAANDEAIEGANAATFTPSAEGSYYVVVRHAAAGHMTREVKSANINVAHFDALAISSVSEDVFQHMGTATTLSVVATGKNVAYVWYTCSNAAGDDAVAIDPAETEAELTIASILEGVHYYKVVISHDCDATTLSHVFKVEGWDQLEQVDVTETTTWDMTNVSANAINLANAPYSCQDTRLLLANIDGVNNNASFNSQALKFEGQHIGRTGAGIKHLAGRYVQFNVTVPGAVFVTFESNGDNARTISINDKKCSRTTSGTAADKYITYAMAVEPGSVEIMGYEGESANKYVRISKIEFKAEASHTRSGLNPSYLGTLCWTNNAILGGATLYKFVGKNENNYLEFEDVPENRIEAGKPYIFMPENGNTQIKVYNTDDEPALTEADLEPVNNMYGTVEGKTLVPGQDDNMYYFSSNHIWAVKDFTVNIPILPNRCYIDYPAVLAADPAPAAAPGRRRVTMGVNGQNVATGMGEIEASETPVKVLINGQIFIIRGEKMFDVTGKLVK